MKVPLLLLPDKAAKMLSRPFLGIASKLAPSLKYLENPLHGIDAGMSLTVYISYMLLNSFLYLIIGGVLSYALLYRLQNASAAPLALGAGLLVGATIFAVGLMYPRWRGKKRVDDVDRNMLFAARHLRIQTTANVPLFESFVSASEGYGAVSEEFAEIVKSVSAGSNFAYALEDSAAKTPSYFYSRILWQISNAVKAGSNVGPVLSDIVDFLAEEQRIEMRNYGAQLNTLAIMYLMMCIIAPTITLIFLMVISSFVALPITDTVFWIILGGLIFVQYMFVGLIESRRPVVSI